MRKFLFAIPALLLVACNSTPTSNSAAAINSTCPMSGEAVGADSPTTTWDGKTVAFCCNKCKGGFEAASADDKAKKMAGTTAAPSK